MIRLKQCVVVGLAALAFAGSRLCVAEVTVPTVFGARMVLQRDEPIPVWGWDSAGQAVEVALDGAKATAKAGDDGAWRVDLPAREAGGPYTLTIKGSSEIALEDVLVGDVWLCSGQSNMQWTVSSSNDFEAEKAAAAFPAIRHITVPRTGTTRR